MTDQASASAADSTNTGTTATDTTTNTGTVSAAQTTPPVTDTGTATTAQNTSETAQTAPQTADTTASATDTSSAASGAPAADSAPVQPPVQQAGVTTTQRKVIQPPSNVQSGAADVSAKPTVQVANTTQAAGTTLTATTTNVVSDLQLPEVAAAMKIAKPQTQSALGTIIDYCAKMHPGKPQTQKQIETNQIELGAALYTVLASEDTNFKPVYQALLALVRAHRNDCFKVTMRNRGLNTVSLASIDNKQMRFLTRMIDLLVLTSGTNDLQQVKQHFDFTKFLTFVPNAKIAQNLTAYYS